MGARSRWIGVVMLLVLGGHAGPVAAQSAGFLHRHQTKDEPKPAAPGKLFPFDITWVLLTINDKPVALADPPSFSIDHTLRGRGFGGCGSFSMALYPNKDQTLFSGAIATSKGTCAPELMVMERNFLVTLHSQPKWDLLGDGDLTLTLGRTVMRFRRGV